MSGADLLSGLRVLDFSRVMAGPFCTALLADLGAEVIKVEPPSGDDYRHIGPFKGGESALFLLMNRNKKGLTLNLKSAQGAALAQGLAACCDVVVENFKPGVAKRLGVDHQTLIATNPRLVYASISGFGQSGPFAERPAYDLIAQAMAGIMSVTGDPQGPPTRTGESLADLSAGLYAAWAIMVALFARERSGRGRWIDVAMFDSLFSLLPTALGQYLYAGMTPQRTGNRHPLSSPFGSFRAGDGDVVIAVANDALFARLARAMGSPNLSDDPRFASDELRTRNEPSLRAAIEAWTGRLTVGEVVAVLNGHGVPGAPIWTVEQAAESAQVAFRKLLATTEHPRLGEIALIEQPVHFSDTPRGGHAPPPLLGEHTEAVLSKLLGIEGAEIEALRRGGVI
jgi:CoA:oxalate CoA-transferase